MKNDTRLVQADPFLSGHRANLRGAEVQDNPHPAGSELAKLWERGWLDAHNQSANRLGSPRKFQPRNLSARTFGGAVSRKID